MKFKWNQGNQTYFLQEFFISLIVEPNQFKGDEKVNVKPNKLGISSILLKP